MRNLLRACAIALLLISLPLQAQSLAAEAESCLKAVEVSGGRSADTGLVEVPACGPVLARIESQQPAGSARDPTTVDGLRDALAFHQDAVRKAGAALETGAVADILAGIGRQEPRPERSTWERFTRWLRELLRVGPKPVASDPAWLRWLESIPHDVLRAIWWTLFALMALGLVWIVVRELREAWSFARKTKPPAVVGGIAAQSPAEAALRLGDIPGLPDSAQAAALLRVTLKELRAADRLPADESLTNGELRRRLVADASESQLFGLIVGSAESQVYGRRAVAPDRLQALIRAAACFETAG